MRLLILPLAVALAVGGCGAAEGEPVTIFAAASLTGALDDALDGCGEPVRISYAASSTLARQILEGAPADLYLSANAAWMDEVEAAGRIVSQSRVVLLGNSLVVVAPTGSARESLHTARRIAVGDPEHVPAGMYAERALRAEGAWERIRPRLVYAANTRAALAFVTRGEVDAGIVYETDAAAVEGLGVLRAFPPEATGPIEYPAALVRGADARASKVERAKRVLAWLRGDRARAAFRRAGFRPGSAP